MPDQCNSRRDFLHTGACAVVSLALCGLSEAALRALPVRAVAGRGAGSDRAYPIPPDDSVNIDHQAGIIIVRYHNEMLAFSLSCPHQHAALKWVEGEHRFQCTKHDSRYQPDGVHISGRATRNMDRFPVRLEGGQLVVDTSQVYRSDQNETGWDAAAVALAEPPPNAATAVVRR